MEAQEPEGQGVEDEDHPGHHGTKEGPGSPGQMVMEEEDKGRCQECGNQDQDEGAQAVRSQPSSRGQGTSMLQPCSESPHQGGEPEDHPGGDEGRDLAKPPQPPWRKEARPREEEATDPGNPHRHDQFLHPCPPGPVPPGEGEDRVQAGCGGKLEPCGHQQKKENQAISQEEGQDPPDQGEGSTRQELGRRKGDASGPTSSDAGRADPPPEPRREVHGRWIWRSVFLRRARPRPLAAALDLGRWCPGGREGPDHHKGIPEAVKEEGAQPEGDACRKPGRELPQGGGELRCQNEHPHGKKEEKEGQEELDPLREEGPVQSFPSAEEEEEEGGGDTAEGHGSLRGHSHRKAPEESRTPHPEEDREKAPANAPAKPRQATRKVRASKTVEDG